MSEPFIGEIKMFAGNFAPRGWAQCDGVLVAISQNEALFSLLGTIYGGDGRTTFGLPDLRGRVPVHAGDGPGLTSRRLGQKAGVDSVVVRVTELPPHTHAMSVSSDISNVPNPGGNITARPTSVDLYADQTPSEAMNPNAISRFGGDQPHDNMMPFQAINFIIALVGIYPSRQ